MEIQARAKINWSLNVVGQRADGYHLLDSVMQPLALSDILTIEKSPELSLSIDGTDGLKADESNLVLRAAKALQQAGNVQEGAAIRLEKRIPMGAGLGGGSADVAAALKGLNQFWGLHYSLEKLCEIGVKLGADVPFCLHDAPRRAQGIGEVLSEISCGKTYPLVLVQPCRALSTKEVFTAYHQSTVEPANTEKVMEALQNGDLDGMDECARNELETVSLAMLPQIQEAKDALMALGAKVARMTGSGSVVFGAFEDQATAKQACEQLKKQYNVCILTETAL